MFNRIGSWKGGRVVCVGWPEDVFFQASGITSNEIAGICFLSYLEWNNISICELCLNLRLSSTTWVFEKGFSWDVVPMLLWRATSLRPLNIPNKLCRCQCSTLCSIPHSSALHVLPLSVLPSRTQKLFELLFLARFKPTASHQIGQITTNGLDPCLEIRQHPNLFDLKYCANIIDDRTMWMPQRVSQRQPQSS